MSGPRVRAVLLVTLFSILSVLYNDKHLRDEYEHGINSRAKLHFHG